MMRPCLGSASSGYTMAVPTIKYTDGSFPRRHDTMLRAYSLGRNWWAWRTDGDTKHKSLRKPNARAEQCIALLISWCLFFHDCPSAFSFKGGLWFITAGVCLSGHTGTLLHHNLAGQTWNNTCGHIHRYIIWTTSFRGRKQEYKEMTYPPRNAPTKPDRAGNWVPSHLPEVVIFLSLNENI